MCSCLYCLWILTFDLKFIVIIFIGSLVRVSHLLDYVYQFIYFFLSKCGSQIFFKILFCNPNCFKFWPTLNITKYVLELENQVHSWIGCTPLCAACDACILVHNTIKGMLHYPIHICGVLSVYMQLPVLSRIDIFQTFWLSSESYANLNSFTFKKCQCM